MKFFYTIAIFLNFFFITSTDVWAETPQSIMADIEKMAQVSGEELELYGLYPGITRDAAVAIAKKAKQVMVLKETPLPKSSILYETNSPNAEIAINFHYPHNLNAENVNDYTLLAEKIIIKVKPKERGARFEAEEFINGIQAKLGEPDDDKYSQTYYAIKVEDKDLYNQCSREMDQGGKLMSSARGINTALKDPVKTEHVQIILDNCPDVIENYKKFQAQQLGPSLSYNVNDGDSQVMISMTYEVDKYFSPTNRFGPNYDPLVK